MDEKTKAMDDYHKSIDDVDSWYKKCGRDKCEYGDKCDYCDPVYCKEMDENGGLVVPLTFRFKPKSKEQVLKMVNVKEINMRSS